MSEHKFIQAYNDLMGHLYEIMDDGLHSLADGLEKAKAKTHLMSTLTQEDMQKVAQFLQRDLEGAANNAKPVNKTNLSEWLKFDVNLIENFALDAFLSVADKTSVELAKLQQQTEPKHYYAGEIVSPGTLQCIACSNTLVFKSTSAIPNCPECGTNAFVRHVD